jgi:hypothetical protein
MRIARYAMRKIPLSMTIASRSTTFALKDPSRQTSTLNVSPGYIGPEKRSDTERTAPAPQAATVWRLHATPGFVDAMSEALPPHLPWEKAMGL